MPDAPNPAAPSPADCAMLFQAHRGIAAKVAGSYCRHPDDRADLIQEIAAQAWRRSRATTGSGRSPPGCTGSR